MNSTNRRGFLKLTGLGILAASVSKIFSVAPAYAQPAPQVASEKDPIASSLGYHADAKKVDNKKWPKHAGAEGAKQLCSGCMFYQTKQAKGDQAPCQILSNKLVKAGGWCNSWAKKA